MLTVSSLLQVFLIGALAKLGATVMTYPLLLIKSRLMSQSKTDAAEMRYSGTVDALVRIYKQDGTFTMPSQLSGCCVNA